MSELLKKITSRGYLRVIIRPTDFNPKRILDIALLFPTLDRIVVKLRGWDFPHLDYRNPPTIGMDWIGQEFEWEHHLALWRFYQSGQFYHVAGIPIDWRDQSSFWPADGNWKPGTLLGVGDILFSLTEVLEFASRLALTDVGGEIMHIEIELGNIKERMLYVDSSRRWPLDFVYRVSIESFPCSIELQRADLIAKTKETALGVASELFKRFGWNVTTESLRSWQEELNKQ